MLATVFDVESTLRARLTDSNDVADRESFKFVSGNKDDACIYQNRHCSANFYASASDQNLIVDLLIGTKKAAPVGRASARETDDTEIGTGSSSEGTIREAK